MWAELFLWNKQNLISEIDQFDSALQEMRAALVADDRDKLEEMFRLSTQRRAAFDKKLPVYSHSEVLSLAHIRLTAMAWNSWLT